MKNHTATRRIRWSLAAWLLVPALLFGGLGMVAAPGCVKPQLIRGTHIPDKARNREIIKVVEQYRRHVEARKISALMAMAHPHYYEHSGTPVGADDYGHKGLLKVLRKRLTQTVAVRCNLKYMRIHWPSATQAEVELYISASFQLKTKEGERWHRMTDYNKMTLVKDNDRWLFLRGM